MRFFDITDLQKRQMLTNSLINALLDSRNDINNGNGVLTHTYNVGSEYNAEDPHAVTSSLQEADRRIPLYQEVINSALNDPRTMARFPNGLHTQITAIHKTEDGKVFGVVQMKFAATPGALMQARPGSPSPR